MRQPVEKFRRKDIPPTTTKISFPRKAYPLILYPSHHIPKLSGRYKNYQRTTNLTQIALNADPRT